MNKHMIPEKYNSKPCATVNPPYLNGTDHEAVAVCMLCVRGGRPSKCHRAGVAKIRASMKNMAKEKVGTSSTNTVQGLACIYVFWGLVSWSK